MVYIFHGADDFSLREAVAVLKATLGAGDPSLLDLNTAVLDGRTLTFPELQAHCETVPFLAPARLVIVEGLLARLARRGRGREASAEGQTEEAAADPQEGEPPEGEGPSEAVDGAWAGLPDLLRRVPPTTTLVVLEGELKAGTALVRSIVKLAQVREFRPLRGKALLDWIQERVARAGGSITPGAVRLLADLVGDNLWAMAAEIAKLCTYALDRTITEQEVQALTVGAREASIFTLVDAIMGRKLPEASRTLRQLLDDGAAPPYLLFMIARQVRALLLARDLLDADRRVPAAQRLGEEEIGKRIGITHPFALRKALEQARSAARPLLLTAYHRLLEADLALKTGRMEGDLAVELLVVELCRGGTAAARM
ncbi:MAG: DNA polymerase III subunit delta [Chloroflexi bacterium]|nr:DNA polymerase III subunit delta [Chloroflexota bacterium]